MKNFLHKSLLLMALFLGSCGFFESDSDSELKDLIGGKTGIFVMDKVTYGFYITHDIQSYIETEAETGYVVTDLPYSHGTSTKATYEGTMKIKNIVDNKYHEYEVKVVLSDLDEKGGEYTMYIVDNDDEPEIDEVGFAWGSYSTSSYSSIIEAISQ